MAQTIAPGEVVDSEVIGVDESRKFEGSLVGRLIDDALSGEYTSSHGGIASEICEPGKGNCPRHVRRAQR